jgi:chromosome segregation protein
MRAIDRLKIRVEEAGGSGEDVRSEYKEAVEREAFLAKELEDLSKSAAGLHELIKDLDEELTKSFAEGLLKVNSSFGEFFALMFGGGSAKLVLEEIAEADEESEDELEYDESTATRSQKNRKPGIEISVALPKKRVQSLMQLSGGERALTSIALIFAMSQVNPPPFLILDETDAALDEANSRRYGDMIENLAKKSQLIVISHNRETMSRAGILYGVTMGADGISKLLSVKFEEAVMVAK